MKNSLLLFASILFSISLFSQEYNRGWLESFARTKAIEYQRKKAEADAYAKKNGLVIRQTLPDGTEMELQKIDDGVPQYFITNNAGAAQTTRANTLYSGGGLGLNVTGNGYDKVAVWDGGKVRGTHQEFDTRVTYGDSWSTESDHSTHVAGTIIASGVDADAKGMAYEAELTSYYWDNDESEMATAGANGMELSNHSYGYGRGWVYDGANWNWAGSTSISSVEDYKFGFYNSDTKEWDDIAYNAPYYLICKSAGNDRGDGPGTTPATAEIDGGDDGYDCIGTRGIAKNILTVGAAYEVQEYTGPSDVVISYFSSWGPVDDGRIKPDIVAKGMDLYSASSSADDEYILKSGTSMSSPNATGTLVLLQQHYQNTHSSNRMKAATLKALAINTADECGPDIGPDYMFGWGLLNAEKAATLISDDASGMNVIDERTLTDGGTYTRNITVGSTPVKVSIVWTDPSGTPVAPQLDPITPMLVNDIDLRLSDGTSTYYSWKLDRDNPSNAATNSGENNVDNVETVYIANPTPGTYTITVDHDGTLASSQDFSIVIQGLDEYTAIPTACASLISPSDGATNIPLTTTIQWSEVSDATSYDVYFGTDPSATNILNGVNQGTTVLNQCLSASTTYYLKVYPRNNQGVRTSCSIWSFSTGNPSIVSLPYTENFDALTEPNIPSNWAQATDDDFDWETLSGTTPSGNTGPDDDVTGGQEYLYTEASVPNSPDKRAIIYTPYFDLNSLSNPKFTFSYHMFGAYMGALRVEIFYEGEWINLFYKTGQQQFATSDAWKEFTIDLTPYKGCSYQRIRFYSTSGSWASDMAVDEISITDVPQMTLNSVTTVQGPTSTVSPGSSTQQIVSVEIVTSGSNAPFSATSFLFNTRGTIDPQDIQNARLYYTGNSSTFTTNNLIGSLIAEPNDVFSINPTQAESVLSEGTNYFWLTYDITSTANPCYYIDAECNSVTINSLAVIPTVQAPAGERQVEGTDENIFFDDFETDLGWTLSGEFERAAPQGLGGEHGNPDPSSAFSGTNVLGSDLTGLGPNSGDYEASIGNRAYQAISPTINCTGESSIHLTFKQWLNVESPTYDHVYIDVWNGSSWVQKYTNTNVVSNSSWQSIDIDVSAEADGNASFKIRYSVGATDGSWFYSGWNIDDLSVDGEATCSGINGLWTGASGDGNWNTADNWDSGTVPGGAIDVIIPNRNNLLTVDATVACNDLIIKDGGTLTCGSGGNMTINGSFYTGQGNSGTFNMNAGSCSITGNFHSEIGSHINIAGGTLGFVNWSKNSTEQWAKGNIHLSGGTINASGSVYFSSTDVSGTMDGPFNLNIGDDMYINDIGWPIVSGGTITMTGSETHGFVSSNINYNAVGFNIVLSGGGTYVFARGDGIIGWDVKNNLILSNGTLQTTNTETNSYFNVVGNVNIGNSGIFNHGAFSSTIGGKLNIGAGSGGSFNIDAGGNCSVGQVAPVANNATKPNKNDKPLEDSIN